jgi:hypothetical protein
MCIYIHLVKQKLGNTFIYAIFIKLFHAGFYLRNLVLLKYFMETHISDDESHRWLLLAFEMRIGTHLFYLFQTPI